jgi:hypothetical protein
LVSLAIALTLAWGQVNLATNEKVTAKIKDLDVAFFKGFDVYPAGVKEAPTALLFDIKGGCKLPCRVSKTALSKEKVAQGKIWGAPLSQAEIIYAIKALDAQYTENKLTFPPRALNIVNVKGEVLGYVYTSLDTVLMDRKKDGTVLVYPPSIEARLKGN